MARRGVERARNGMDAGEEIEPIDQLHREKPGLAIRRQLIEVDQVGVGHVGEGPKLLLANQDQSYPLFVTVLELP